MYSRTIGVLVEVETDIRPRWRELKTKKLPTKNDKATKEKQGAGDKTDAGLVF